MTGTIQTARIIHDRRDGIGDRFASSPIVISEAGRAFLADRLARLSPAQIRALFEGAGFARAPHAGTNAAQTIDEWVAAFEQKRRAIIDRPRCPTP